MDIVLLGPPGAGKGTQAERLAVRFSCPQVATGDIFRAALKEGTSLGLEAKGYMDAGELVPDEVVERIVAERLEAADVRDGFILDGFPRSIHQAEALDGYLSGRGRALDAVVNIVVDSEELVRRLTGRRGCPECGQIYHLVSSPPEAAGACDSCGGELYQRDDDNERTVRNRLEVYRGQTEPLIGYYRPGGRLREVDGAASPDEVFNAICVAIGAAAGGGSRVIDLKTREEIEKMRAAGRLVAAVLEAVVRFSAVGVTTLELDELAEEMIRDAGAVPAFKGYQPEFIRWGPFPATLCTSINSEVVHGIPDSRPLEEGDLLSIDTGVELGGYFGDAAVSVIIGEGDPEVRRLVDTTRRALNAAIGMCWPKKHLSDVSHAVQQLVEAEGYSVVRRFVGHGIGRDMHEDPPVPNFGEPDHGPLLKPGLVLAIEPMVNMGAYEVVASPDCWQVYTKDGSASAHFEHTVAVTEDGPDVLTARAGVAASLEMSGGLE